jgi:hypothetical protein
MQHIYTVNQVECQPQNDNVPPIRRRSLRRMLGIGVAMLGFAVSVYATWMQGGGL